MELLYRQELNDPRSIFFQACFGIEVFREIISYLDDFEFIDWDQYDDIVTVIDDKYFGNGGYDGVVFDEEHGCDTICFYDNNGNKYYMYSKYIKGYMIQNIKTSEFNNLGNNNFRNFVKLFFRESISKEEIYPNKYQ